MNSHNLPNKDSLPYFQILLVSAILLSAVSSYLFVKNDFHIAHFDSKGHLLVPRRIFDNLRPGFKQIGAFWLPFPHLLYLPFVQSDRLYFSGVAGLPISVTCFISTVLVLFKLIERIFGRFPAFCGSVLYLTNPNLLYLQSTPLTENISLLCMIGSVYLFVFFQSGSSRKYLFWASFVSVLGILSRYENWFVFAGMCLLLLILSILRRRGIRNFLIDSAILVPLNVAAIGLTFWINWYTTGHAYMDHSFKHTDFQPASGSFFLAFLVILYTVGNLISYDWVVFTLIAAFFLFRSRYRDPSFLAALALLAPLILYLYEYRDNHPTRIRYGIPFLPGIVLFLTYWAGRSKLSNYLFPIFTCYVALFSPFHGSGSNSLLEESIRDADNLAIQHDLLWYLKEHDDGQLILASMSEIAPVLYDLRLPVKRYIHEGAKPYWNDANKHPEKVAGWVFLVQDDRLWKIFHGNREFHRHFALIGRSGYLELYRRAPDEKSNLKSHKPHPSMDKYPLRHLPGI
jgi:hypothetical protein